MTRYVYIFSPVNSNENKQTNKQTKQTKNKQKQKKKNNFFKLLIFISLFL